MKKIVNLCMLLFSLVGLISCSEDKIDTYSGTNNIYFSPAAFREYIVDNSWAYIDSTGFSFGLDGEHITNRIFKIPVRVQGKISDQDRPIKLTIDPSSTAIEGKHFTLPENIVMRAGTLLDTIVINVARTADMKTDSFKLVLNLEENQFFKTQMNSKITNTLTNKTLSYTQFKLTFDDKLGQPKGWKASFGVFTAKKFFLMCELMHLETSMFNQALGAPGLTVPETTYYQNFMKRYLADQKASGNTVYEEDGSEMIFP